MSPTNAGRRLLVSGDRLLPLDGGGIDRYGLVRSTLKRKRGCRYDDPPMLKHRLAQAHHSARQATEHAGRLLEKIADLEKQIAMRDRVIHSLRQTVYDYQEESLADSHLRSIRFEET